MSTLIAPVQSNGTAWKESRLGRFTASDIGKLFIEPKTIPKDRAFELAHLVSVPPTRQITRGKRKGLDVLNEDFLPALREAGVVFFGDTALSLIASKAGERMTNCAEFGGSTRSMDRGSILEPVAKHFLSKYWKPIAEVTFLPYGDNAGATPDGLTDDGKATIDIKCPERFGDVLLYDQAIYDVTDFEGLEAWSRDYAWQVMMQCKCAGTHFGYLVYFTDRLPIRKMDEMDKLEAQAIIDFMCERLSESNEYPKSYTMASEGFHFVAKRFELTKERSERIDRVLAAAEEECQRFMALMQD